MRKGIERIFSESTSHARTKVQRQREILARMHCYDPERAQQERILATMIDNLRSAEMADVFNPDDCSDR